MKIFIYGTLKKGHSRAYVMEQQEFLGKAKTIARYHLYNINNSFPALVEDPDGVEIEGELWEVSEDCIRQLDRIEGYQEGANWSLYIREDVELSSHPDEKVISYLYNQSVDGLDQCSPSWEGA